MARYLYYIEYHLHEPNPLLLYIRIDGPFS